MRNWLGWALLLWAMAASSAQAGLVEVIEAAKPSVLAVGTYNPLKTPRFAFRGTGFVVGNGTLVVTNTHVLPPADAVEADNRLMVLLPRPDEAHELRAATVLHNDPSHDLALLKIEGSALPALALGEAQPLRDGHAVALIGYPVAGVLGYKPVTHRGIVASVTAVALPAPSSRSLDPRAVLQLRQGPFVLYQLDATAYPGNSGGPLLDAGTGAVVGVVNMGLLKATKESALALPSGITYAIPTRYVLELLKDR